MKFGIVLPTFGANASRLEIVETALAAERMGYDSIWVTDHLALPRADAERFGCIFEAITTLSYLAASTRSVHLGISTLVLPQRNPVEVAKEIATLDVLSGGRMIVTAGIGWSAGEYANLGQNFKNRARRMDEALQVLRTLWSGETTASFQGRYYHFDEAVIDPQPLQLGGPPLWVAGNSPTAVMRAVHYGDGWHPSSARPDQLAEWLAPVRPVIGARPFTICARVNISISDQPDISALPISGTPSQVREQLKAYEQAGANYIILYFRAETQAERESAMQTFYKEIISGWEQGI